MRLVKPANFSLEKQIQSLVERNLGEVFSCRFVASEVPTGREHAGRIDTLALSEDNNPVIIEYKKVESSELVTQSLYYLSWLSDHRGDFEIVARKKLGANIEISWDEIRVICIAPGYRKFDLHAVKVMGANIELWQYRLFANNCIYLEEIFRRDSGASDSPAWNGASKNPVMVEAGKKAAATRMQGTYTFEEHIENKPTEIQKVVEEIRQFILDLDESVEESPKKFYVAYKLAKNFVCMEVHHKKITLFLKLDPAEISPFPVNARDVSNIGHYGTGDLEFMIHSRNDVDLAKQFIKASYEAVGGS